MKIITEGNLDDRQFTGTCPACRCEFKCSYQELEKDTSGEVVIHVLSMTFYVRAKCPMPNCVGFPRMFEESKPEPKKPFLKRILGL